MKRLWRTTTQLSKHFSEASIGFRTQALISVAVLMGLLVVLSDSTHAYLTSRVSVPGNFISTLSFDDAFILSPGKARAVRVSDRPKPGEGASFLVARENEDGEIELDFGEVPQGNSKNFPDAFRIANISERNLTGSIMPEGEIAQLIDRVWIEGSDSPYEMNPDEMAHVDVKLSVSSDASPGSYDGSLVLGGFLAHEIKAVVTVR